MRTKTDWQFHIRNWQESGLSKAEYCRRNGINRFSFYSRTRSEQPGKNDARLTELGFPLLSRASATPEPAFELALKFPFQFRFRINISLGGKA